MKIICEKLGMLENNCFIVYDENTKIGVCIDVASGSEKLLNFIMENEIKLEYILLTHGHYDHILEVSKLAQETNAKIVIHKDDIDLIPKEVVVSYYPSLANKYIEFKPDILAENASKIKFGNLFAEYIHTKGHTKGSCVIKIEDCLFTGDTLFKGECGRCDLYGGNFDEMLVSLKMLSKLDENFIVYPGHGDFSDIKCEKANNKYMQLAMNK